MKLFKDVVNVCMSSDEAEIQVTVLDPALYIVNHKGETLPFLIGAKIKLGPLFRLRIFAAKLRLRRAWLMSKRGRFANVKKK